jgi:hypothetical protein
MTPKVLWEIVKAAAGRAGIEKLAPHDLRRTPLGNYLRVFGHQGAAWPSVHAFFMDAGSRQRNAVCARSLGDDDGKALLMPAGRFVLARECGRGPAYASARFRFSIASSISAACQSLPH